MTEPSFLAEHIIPGLRFAEMTLWSMIVLYNLPSLWRLIICRWQTGDLDWLKGVIVLAGIGVIVLQMRSLLGIVPLMDDPFTIALLLCFLVSAVVFMAWAARMTPKEHRSAFILSRLGVTVACVAVGGLM